MQLSQPTLEPHSLCYTCWVQVVYSLLPTLLFFPLGDTLLLLSSCRREGVRSVLPGLRGLLGVHLPVDIPVAPCSASESFYRICITLPHTLYQTFCHYCNKYHSYLLYYIFYVICAMIYYSFCCIYVWLDPGTYIIARFMSFCKPGVTYNLKKWRKWKHPN